MQDDLLNAQFLPRNLHEDRVHALPHLRSGAVHLGDGATRSSEQFHAAFRRIVKTFAVGDVLVADGKPDAPPQSLAATHIPGTSGIGQRITFGRHRGRSIAAQRRITSRTGALPWIVWPVRSTDPVETAFLRRSATGSMRNARASLSIWASWATQACTAPNPRIAPQGGLCVYTAVPSINALGTS